MSKHRRRDKSLKIITQYKTPHISGIYKKEQDLINSLSNKIQEKNLRNSTFTVQSNINYPKIQVQKENQEYAQILCNDFSGEISEFSTIAQYTNHEIRMFNKYNNAHKVLSSIAQTEMMHLQIIGKLIVLLGGALNYSYVKNDSCSIWTSKFVNYGTNFVNMILLDINNEYKAIRQYEEHIKLIDDKYIKEILRRIIIDEKYHIELLSELLEKNKNIEKDDIR
ncbi:MAG: ferritin family protein [Clostridium sp.]